MICQTIWKSLGKAKTVTKEQARKVLEYLDEKHNRQLWFLRARKTQYLGMGVRPSPTEDNAKLPSPRIEVLVFVPQS